MFYHMGGRRDWGALGAEYVQEKLKMSGKGQKRVKISGYLARARARARAPGPRKAWGLRPLS